jgi:excisionase family DNA binding protein
MDGIVTRSDAGPVTPEDASIAAAARDLLLGHGDNDLHLLLDDGKEVVLPRAAAVLLRELLTEMARGNAISLLPVHMEFTTQQAADFLNVSRPYLIGLLEKGAIPFHKVGTHRRIGFSDLESYKKRSLAKSNAAMDELAGQAQELGLGY